MKMKDSIAFLNILDELIEIGINQSKAARNIGEKPQRFANIRNGTSSPTYEMFKKLEDYHAKLLVKNPDKKDIIDSSKTISEVLQLRKEVSDMKGEVIDLKMKVNDLEEKLKDK